MFRTALILSLLASPATAFTTQNGMLVSGNSEQIVVASRTGLSSAQAWCAAGEFVVRALGMSSTTQVYRVSAPPRRATEAIVFSISEKGASDDTGLATFGGSGNSLSASRARGLCTACTSDYN